MSANDQVLYIIVPCCNEEAVLPMTSGMFLAVLGEMVEENQISDQSRILFVDDGSKDSTWEIISGLAKKDMHFTGIRQSRNRGHQNAVLAGLMESAPYCDVTVSIDCDGQDDIHAIKDMVAAYKNGADIVYGVRKSRKEDALFKRATARGFYRLLSWLGAETVYDHADFRLLSRRAVDALAQFQEVNLYLRGLVPLVGFNSTCVYYERKKRLAGKTHYSVRKMLGLALDGILSFSIKPIRLITVLGGLVAFLSFLGILWAVAGYFRETTVHGWASTICVICFVSGVQLLSLGIIGEYIGKIYLEVKRRPRYIIQERTWEEKNIK